LDRIASWDSSNAGTAWIIRHALRTLVKKGDPRALEFFGVDAASARHVTVRRFAVSPTKIKLGDSVLLNAELVSKAKSELPVVVDYVVHYPRASGNTSVKVFKWAEVRLQPGKTLTLTKRQTIRDFTTRKHHAGRHWIELQVNGQRLAKTSFQLRVAP